MKALEALQKSQKGDVFKRPLPVNSNKENSKSAINVSSTNNPSSMRKLFYNLSIGFLLPRMYINS